jgi:enoyl-CoA hydratase
VITSSLSDRIATVTIARQDKANSLSQAGKSELAAELRRWHTDSNADAIVLTGEGDRAFCAGSDINEMRAFGMAEMDAMLDDERAMYLAALTCPKPVVAAVNGHALGAGLILTLSCDYTLAAPHATFGAPELTIGVAAPLEGLLLPYFVGVARARAMFYTGTRMDAQEAVTTGLINELASAAELLVRAKERARTIADLPGEGFSIQKLLLHRLHSTGNLEAVIRESHHLTSRQFTRPTTGQAMTRFLSRKGGEPSTPSQSGATPAEQIAQRLPTNERDWMTQEAQQVARRSATLAGEAAWRPDEQP